MRQGIGDAKGEGRWQLGRQESIEHAFNTWEGSRLIEEDVLEWYSCGGEQHSMRGMDGEPDLISGHYHMNDARLRGAWGMGHGARGMWLESVFALLLCVPVIAWFQLNGLTALVINLFHASLPAHVVQLSVPNSVQLSNSIKNRYDYLSLCVIANRQWFLLRHLCNHLMKITNLLIFGIVTSSNLDIPREENHSTTFFLSWCCFSDVTLEIYIRKGGIWTRVVKTSDVWDVRCLRRQTSSWRWWCPLEGVLYSRCCRWPFWLVEVCLPVCLVVRWSSA